MDVTHKTKEPTICPGACTWDWQLLIKDMLHSQVASCRVQMQYQPAPLRRQVAYLTPDTRPDQTRQGQDQEVGSLHERKFGHLFKRENSLQGVLPYREKDEGQSKRLWSERSKGQLKTIGSKACIPPKSKDHSIPSRVWAHQLPLSTFTCMAAASSACTKPDSTSIQRTQLIKMSFFSFPAMPCLTFIPFCQQGDIQRMHTPRNINQVGK